MPRPKGSSDPEETRERILSAAERVFAKRGYHAAPLSEIAAIAGMRAPSLLYHFASKEALFDEVIRRSYRALEEQLSPVLQNVDPDTSLPARLLQSLRAFENEHRDLFRTVNAELLSPNQRGSTAIRDTLIPLIDRVEALIRATTAGRIPPNAPLRQVLLHIISAHAVRTNLGPLADDLWGRPDREFDIASALLSALMDWQEPGR